MANKEVDERINSLVKEQTNKIEYDNIDKNKPTIKIEGDVKVRKKSLADKFSETFLSEDVGNVKEYVFKDIVVPAVKDLLFDSITNTIQMIIFGTTSKRGSGGYGYNDYRKYSSNKSNFNKYSTDPGYRNRDRFDFSGLEFNERRDAERVLYMLYDYIHAFGHATVADYYNAFDIKQLRALGIYPAYTDGDWGWTDVSEVTIRRAPGGMWYLTLPRPKPID